MKRRADLRPHPYIFVPLKEEELLRMTEKRIWSRMDICILARPGSYKEAGFEERFKQEMKQKLAIGNYFFVNLTPVSDLKAAMMERYGVNESIQYHTAFAIFFLLNIFLGIIGTFWLRIEKRKGEIGIRIALGAARRGVLRQMLSESFLLLTIAAIPALLICLNIVVAGLMPDKDFDLTKVRFAIDTAATFALLAIVIASATWYPARRAAAIPPADALHYE
jgi:putative ABC transport system permease protein